MFRFIGLCLGTLVRLLHARRSLLLENLALRQQLAMLKRRHPRPSIGPFDKLFWVAARRFWSGWKQSLIVVTPETVVRWHRAGFRLYWSFISKVRKQVRRKRLSNEVKDLIFRMVAENPTWAGPRIHGQGHPPSSGIVQQLREAFPYQSAPKFLILDHDAKYGLEVPAAIRSMSITCLQIRSA